LSIDHILTYDIYVFAKVIII